MVEPEFVPGVTLQAQWASTLKRRASPPLTLAPKRGAQSSDQCFSGGPVTVVAQPVDPKPKGQKIRRKLGFDLSLFPPPVTATRWSPITIFAEHGPPFH